MESRVLSRPFESLLIRSVEVVLDNPRGEDHAFPKEDMQALGFSAAIFCPLR